MKQEDLFDALDGLSAYDDGCIDSGIHDEILRQQVKDYLKRLSEEDFRVIMATYIHDYFVSKEAIKQGYGIEDIKSFIDWLDREMDISL